MSNVKFVFLVWRRKQGNHDSIYQLNAAPVSGLLFSFFSMIQFPPVINSPISISDRHRRLQSGLRHHRQGRLNKGRALLSYFAALGRAPIPLTDSAKRPCEGSDSLGAKMR